MKLAGPVLTDLLASPDAEFRAVGSRIAAKNQELYKRLALNVVFIFRS